jgi:hypothetical protein
MKIPPNFGNSATKKKQKTKLWKIKVIYISLKDMCKKKIKKGLFLDFVFIN